MILSKTPLRISLFGGGSDYKEWSDVHGGATIGFAIDKHVYVSVRELKPYFDYKHRVVWSMTELVKTVEEIQNPAARAALSFIKPHCGVEVIYTADLPAMSGMGSSSSFMVGLLNALHAFVKEHRPSKQSLAEQATYLEREVLGENVGSQDQVWAAHGGFNKLTFRQDGTIGVSPIILAIKRRAQLEASLMLFYTGKSRHASGVAGKQIANFHAKEKHLLRMAAMVDDAQYVLQDPYGAPLDELGRLLHEAWTLKRDLAEGVTTARIDEIYTAGREAGASGGKLLGAGGGGFMLFCVPPEKRQDVKEALSDLVQVDFRIGVDGSSVPVYHPNGV